MYKSKIPEDVIAAVLKAHDIVDVVGKTVHLVKRGRNYVGLCPFHSEKTPSFNVNPEKQTYHCFGCGEGGGAIRFVMMTDGLSFPEAVRQMAAEANIEIGWAVETAEETEQQRERRTMIEAHELAVKIYHYILRNTVEGQRAMDYIRSRGFTDKWIEDFQIGYAPPGWDTLARYLAKNEFDLSVMDKAGLIVARPEGEGYYDRFRDRVMFPIHDAKGRPIAFSGRAVGDGEPKYLNSPETPLFNKSRTLFNLHRARSAVRKHGTIVLLEGHVDVVRAYEEGIENAVAAMGTALTEHHADTIRRLAAVTILCYDGDKAGQNATAKSVALLEQAGCTVQVSMLPEGLDPDEYMNRYGAEAFKRSMIEAAVSTTRFRLVYMKRNFLLSSDEGRLKYIQAALRLIAELAAPTEREFYLKELSTEYHFSMESLQEQLHLIRMSEQKKNRQTDKYGSSWNNVMQSESGLHGVPALFPAYHNAERKLLAVMMEDREVARYVQERLADRFHVEAHAALAAYLYAFYEQGNDPDPGRFIAELPDDKLAATASKLTFADTAASTDKQVVDDYLAEIDKYAKQMTIKHKKDEQMRAARSGDMERARELGMEIISLEKSLR